MKIKTSAIVAVALIVEGCSSRPREFNAQLAVPAADAPAFQAALATCKELYVTGKLDSNGRLASGAAGAAISAGWLSTS